MAAELSKIATTTTVDDYGIDEGNVGGERRGQEAGGGWRVVGGGRCDRWW